MDLSRYIGIPFEQANCYELFQILYLDQFNIELPPQPYHSASREESRRNAGLVQAEAVKWVGVSAGRERFGDAVLLYIGGMPCHIGFVIGGGRMIHAQEKTFSTIASYRHDLEWRDRTKSFYRHPRLAVADGQRQPESVPHGTGGDAADRGADGGGNPARGAAG